MQEYEERTCPPQKHGQNSLKAVWYTSIMELWQSSVLIFLLLYSTVCLYLGFKNTYMKKNPFGFSRWFNLLGAFVWVDCIMFGIFFFAASLVSFLFLKFSLFFLIYSVFWFVRSLGESIYWFLEQFTNPHRNKTENLIGHKIFPGESIYIHYQIFWQCICVISIICSVYFFVSLLVY